MSKKQMTSRSHVRTLECRLRRIAENGNLSVQLICFYIWFLYSFSISVYARAVQEVLGFLLVDIHVGVIYFKVVSLCLCAYLNIPASAQEHFAIFLICLIILTLISSASSYLWPFIVLWGSMEGVGAIECWVSLNKWFFFFRLRTCEYEPSRGLLTNVV